jgi:hypothetical protein
MFNYRSVSQVACGAMYTVILTEDFKVWVAGDNTSGQCGIPREKFYNTFHLCPIPGNERVRQVFCGTMHTAVVTCSGKLFACGSNSNQQLGSVNNTKMQKEMHLVQFHDDQSEEPKRRTSLEMLRRALTWKTPKTVEVEQPPSPIKHSSSTIPPNVFISDISRSCHSLSTTVLTREGYLLSCGSSHYLPQAGSSVYINKFKRIEFPAMDEKIMEFVSGHSLTLVLTVERKNYLRPNLFRNVQLEHWVDVTILCMNK